jgi:hypothetical protein
LGRLWRVLAAFGRRRDDASDVSHEVAEVGSFCAGGGKCGVLLRPVARGCANSGEGAATEDTEDTEGGVYGRVRFAFLIAMARVGVVWRFGTCGMPTHRWRWRAKGRLGRRGKAWHPERGSRDRGRVVVRA